MKNCTRYGHAAASRSDTRFRAQFHANPAVNLRRPGPSPVRPRRPIRGCTRGCHERRFRDVLHTFVQPVTLCSRTTEKGGGAPAGRTGRNAGVQVAPADSPLRSVPLPCNRYSRRVAATMTGDQPGAPQTRRGPIGALLHRFGHLIHELSKFATVGGFAFLVDFALFNYLASGRGMPPLAAKTISTVIAATIAFLGNRFWTWRHRQRSNPAREYALFFFFNGVGLGIAVACLAISRYGLGAIWPGVFQTPLADNIASFIVGTGLGTLFRFWSYRRFVFVEAGTPPVPATSHDRESGA
ncbi:GtrA family protein [Micromonospora sediminicola]|uniref:GtrA family protein n=1 Tax=Micromonospora sediminicola TaxID=946078 RepID=UPI003795999A